MATQLDESNGQRLHHFLTSAKWSADKLMDWVTSSFFELLVSQHLQDDICLIIDETGNPKKGKKSAGVKRQYCGQLGKVDNCQVGVFGALCGGSLVNLVQAKLFDPGIKKSKIALAKEIINHVACELKLNPTWVAFDAFYGRDTALMADLIEKGLEFVADVPATASIWTEAFQMRIPKAKDGVRGRKPSHKKPTKEGQTINEYVVGLSEKDWKYITVRNQANGTQLKAWFHMKKVFIIDKNTNSKKELVLLIRSDADGTMKFSLCHCKEQDLKKLAYRQSKRYFIEKSFREAKQELGLNEYQTRSSEGYHKHMSMVMLGQYFLNKEKIEYLRDEKMWLTTSEIIQTLKSTAGFMIRTIEKLLDEIIAKQPPDKRLIDKLLYLQI